MDLVAVPAGTPAAQAFLLRGPDPLIRVPPGAQIFTCLGVALRAVSVPGGQAHTVPFSSVAGALAGYLLCDLPALLSRLLHEIAPAPAKLQQVFDYFVAQGLDTTRAYTLREFHMACETIYSTTVDFSNPPAAFLLAAADFLDTQPPGAGLGGAATLWLRSAQLRSVGAIQPSTTGVVRLTYLGLLHFYAPGYWLSQSRDTPAPVATAHAAPVRVQG